MNRGQGFVNPAISSAGSEHLPYKQGVTGSNPVSPTINREGVRSFRSDSFFYWVELGLKNFLFLD